MLASAENSDFTKEMSKDIEELIETIDPVKKNGVYQPVNACESLEILSNFALIEKTVIPILKKGAISAISRLLKHELKEDDSLLAEKGLLSLNERLIIGALGTVYQLISSPQALKTTVFDDILANNFEDELISTIKNKGNNGNICEKALIVINSLLGNEKTKEKLIEKMIKADITDNLTDLLEKFPESPQIAQFTNNLLFNLTKNSSEIAAKLAKQKFVKNLMKNTKNHLKDADIDKEALRLTKQSLQCLTVLSQIGQTADKLASEGGIEFSLMILKKENQMNPLLVDEDQCYSLNLASNEQEYEKKLMAIQNKGGNSEDLEEKTLSFFAVELLDSMIKDGKKAEKFINEEVLKEILSGLLINTDSHEKQWK